MLKFTSNSNNVQTVIGRINNFQNPYSVTTVIAYFSSQSACDGNPDGGVEKTVLFPLLSQGMLSGL